MVPMMVGSRVVVGGRTVQLTERLARGWRASSCRAQDTDIATSNRMVLAASARAYTEYTSAGLKGTCHATVRPAQLGSPGTVQSPQSPLPRRFMFERVPPHLELLAFVFRLRGSVANLPRWLSSSVVQTAMKARDLLLENPYFSLLWSQDV